MYGTDWGLVSSDLVHIKVLPTVRHLAGFASFHGMTDRMHTVFTSLHGMGP